MRYLPTSKLTPGMALGQDIYDGAGRLLLAKHLLLSEEYISNLEFLGFPGIYIDDEFTQGIEIQQVLNPQVRSQALKVVHDMFAFDVDSDAEEDMPVSEIKIQKTIERIVENILSNGDIMCNVLDIKNYDDYIYYHSINVAMMSVLLGANYGMNEESLRKKNKSVGSENGLKMSVSKISKDITSYCIKKETVSDTLLRSWFASTDSLSAHGGFFSS